MEVSQILNLYNHYKYSIIYIMPKPINRKAIYKRAKSLMAKPQGKRPIDIIIKDIKSFPSIKSLIKSAKSKSIKKRA